MDNTNNKPIKQVRKGRPKAAEVIEEINSAHLLDNETFIICSYCRRCFPRKKALQSHIRTHTGDTPYVCTYPCCKSSFKQSGQLKMHIKTHTHEKDYACPVEGCSVRFIHSNRRCKDHPDMKLQNDGKGEIQYNENQTLAEREWLDNYKRTKNKPLKRKKTSEVPSNIPEQSPENPTVSPRQPRILCNSENVLNIGSDLLSENCSQSKEKCAKRRKTLNISGEETVSLRSNVPSTARAETFSSDILDRPSNSPGLSAHVPNLFQQLSPMQYRVSCDIKSTQSSMHSGNLPQNFYEGNSYTYVIERSQSLYQRKEFTEVFDKSSANSLHVTPVTLNSDPKAIRTPVIQSLQRSKTVQTDANTMDAADTLLRLHEEFVFRLNELQW